MEEVRPICVKKSLFEEIFSLDGKTALVTGGSGGIGAMIAGGLVRAGVKTYIASRSISACEETAARLNDLGGAECIPVQADLSTQDGVIGLAEFMKEREPALHILVNNAGTAWGEPFETYSVTGWDKVMELNLKSVFFLTQKLYPLLREAGRECEPSRVINIGSVEGLHTPTYDTYPYGLSKAAVHHLTRLLAKRFAPEHVNVNAIAPGPFNTKMMAWALSVDEIHEEIKSKVPRRRLGEESDLIGAVIYLCSRGGSYVTGAVLPIDGGLTTTL